MRLQDLAPIQTWTGEVPLTAQAITARLEGLVEGRSMTFSNYFKDRGKFVGSVHIDSFWIRRYVKRLYVPLIRGRVKDMGPQSHVSIQFIAGEAIAFASLFPFAFWFSYVHNDWGALRIYLFFPPLHVIGCWVMKSEMERFLRAAGFVEGRAEARS